MTLPLHIVSWEPEGRYCHRLCTAIAPFWFSMKHLWTAIAPFWFSTKHLWTAITPFWLSTDNILFFSKNGWFCNPFINTLKSLKFSENKWFITHQYTTRPPPWKKSNISTAQHKHALFIERGNLAHFDTVKCMEFYGIYGRCWLSENKGKPSTQVSGLWVHLSSLFWRRIKVSKRLSGWFLQMINAKLFWLGG